MEDLITKVMEYAPAILQFLGALCVLATVIVRIPGVNGDAKVDSVVSKVFKAINWLPTVGINPRTKKLEEAVNEIKNNEVKKE